jgi:hypothetical protein
MLLCLVKYPFETHRFEDISDIINLLGVRCRKRGLTSCLQPWHMRVDHHASVCNLLLIPMAQTRAIHNLNSLF